MQGLISSSSRETDIGKTLFPSLEKDRPTEQSTPVPPPYCPHSETSSESDSSEMIKSQVTYRSTCGDGHPATYPGNVSDVTHS